MCPRKACGRSTSRDSPRADGNDFTARPDPGERKAGTKSTGSPGHSVRRGIDVFTALFKSHQRRAGPNDVRKLNIG